jgi:beta-lactamase regulating signal transducer with metallopeptidase domain
MSMREVVEGALLMLGQGAALAALAWAAWAAGLFRRRPALWAALWTVVLLKLVLPWGPEVAGSLSDLWALAQRAVGQPAAPLLPPAEAATSASATSFSWGTALGLALLAGWATISGRRLVRAVLHLRRQRAALAALPPPPARAQARCAALAARFDVATPRLAVHPEPVVPHLLYSPRSSILVVPAQLLGERAPLELAMAHELAHLRRRDPLARWLETFVAALWFFLPVRRLVGQPLERSQEVAADALALRVLALPPATYAQLLVDATARCQRGAAPAALALARPGAPAALVERIEALCLHQSRASIGWLGAAFTVAFALLGLGQARQAGSEVGPACEFSPEIAAALREVHPEADRDGDGELGREEACALQEQLRRSALEGRDTGEVASSSSMSSRPLWQQLCCQCETSSAPEARSEPFSERTVPQACAE